MTMKKHIALFIFSISFSLFSSAKADFGDADFPLGMFDDGPKSYHDAWCRSIKNKCRVRFQWQGMWVEGQGGIFRPQYIRFRTDYDARSRESYNYISYRSDDGREKQALFIFSHYRAQRDFLKAFVRWKKQDPLPIPNYRYPNSQGPQDTQSRDKGLNPYDNPPITDWSEKTTN